MPTIELVTNINAPIEICFDLARSIDLHKLSTAGTGEEAIGGVTSGLIGVGETVTWRAKHFGIRQNLTSVISAFEYPVYFRDEMVTGAFRMIKHDHRFQKAGDITVMRDYFQFESPAGIAGKLFNTLVLTGYLTRLLKKRNQIIKETAETGRWRQLLQNAGKTNA